jgi:uncharacterized membrane protein
MSAAKAKKPASKTVVLFEGERITFTPKQETTISGNYMEREIIRRLSEVEWSYLEEGCVISMPAKSAIEVLEDAGVEGRWSGRRFDLHGECRVAGPLLYREVGFTGIVGHMPGDVVRALREPLGVIISLALVAFMMKVYHEQEPLYWLVALILIPGAFHWIAARLELGRKRTSWGLRFPGVDCIAAKVGQGKD